MSDKPNGGTPPATATEPQEAQSTASMWGQMFGLGPLMKMITDPGLQTHAMGMMQAIGDGARVSSRIEAKLDMLLKAQGYDLGQVNARIERAPAILEGAVAAPDRGFAATSHALDAGIGGTAQDAGEAGATFGDGGGDRQAGDREPSQ